MHVKPQVPEGRKKQQPILFCTECGANLEDFCFSGDSSNVKAAQENMNRCKHTGKFHGEMCAKLFIARTEPPDPALDDAPPNV